MKTYDDFLFNPETELHNLLFYPDGELDCIARENPGEIYCECIAELFRRWFITRSRKTEEVIDSLLPDGERKQLELNLKTFCDAIPSENKLTDDLWKAKTESSKKCQAAVREILRRLCHKTDGFIPVYIEEKAFFIPFHLEQGPSEVRDMTGKKIEEWSEFCRETLEKELGYTCIIHCAARGLPDLTGNSLMLPLLLAGWRKKEKISYNHLRLLATGAIENGTLKAVETSAKALALQKCFPQAYFFFPESTKYYADKPNEIPLPAGMTKKQLLEKMPGLIEIHGLLTPNLRDALRRLPQLLEEREGVSDAWEELLKKVELHEQAISRFSSHQKEYMLCLMLKSSIFCHAGRTEEALKTNRKAQEFAAEKPELEKLLRRMEIEELVELQDQEMFDQLFQLAEVLREKIEILEDPDLLMRYYGTMGQAWTYGTLAGLENCSKELAKESFEKAVECALQTGRPGDIAQDLNYRVLWYAVFDPESDEVVEAYEETERYINFNIEGEFNENVRTKNRNYLLRYRALGLYRDLLMTGTARLEEAEKCLVPGEWWLPATINKYCGAVYAACGKRKEAEECFQKSATLESHGNPIIDMIRLTIFAEAYRSLQDEKYREQALALAALLAEKAPTVSIWQAYLEGRGEFPGLKYWY